MFFLELKNPRVLDILERFRYLYRDKYDITKTNKLLQEFPPDPERYVSEEYLKEVMHGDHNGSPRRAYSYPIKPKHYKGNDPQYLHDYRDADSTLKIELGLESSALSQLYPPKGFIDWHSNANSSSYNILFTWSETGDGWFKWYDTEKDEIVTMPDKKGWSAKAGYYAANEEETPPMYHCAFTNSWRMTLAYTIPPDERYRDFWLDICDYIQCED